MIRRLGCALLALCVFPAFAQADFPRTELRAWAARENLDRGYEDWSEITLLVARRWSRDANAFASRRETRRFGARDRETGAGFSIPLASDWAIALEGTGSASHRVLPRRSVNAQLARSLGDGWVAAAGWRAAEFDDARVHAAALSLEKYVASWRIAYVLNLARPGGAGWSPTHRASVSWYGEGLTSFAAGAARGREAEYVFASGLLTSDIRNASLSASLGLTPRTALTLDLERQRQGRLYTRDTVRLGTRIHF